jgi:hypothetical protein
LPATANCTRSSRGWNRRRPRRIRPPSGGSASASIIALTVSFRLPCIRTPSESGCVVGLSPPLRRPGDAIIPAPCRDLKLTNSAPALAAWRSTRPPSCRIPDDPSPRAIKLAGVPHRQGSRHPKLVVAMSQTPAPGCRQDRVIASAQDRLQRFFRALARSSVEWAHVEAHLKASSSRPACPEHTDRDHPRSAPRPPVPPLSRPHRQPPRPCRPVTPGSAC